jgi:hypothetical protein
VQLGCFGTDEIDLCGWKVDKIESSLSQRVHIVEVQQCMRYLTQEHEETCVDALHRSRVD